MALIGASLVATGPVVAQTKAAASDQSNKAGIETVTVTAQHRSQSLQTAPIAITAVSAAMMEARSQISISQITANTPNVTLLPGSSFGGPSLVSYIRGVGQYDFNFALEPGVGMYVDDVYYSTLPGTIFDLLDLDRVEVLRGPQGTLAGMNSIGGAVKLYSKKPNGSNDMSVQGTYGSFNRTEFRGSADFTIIPDQVFGRIAGVSRHQDGYVTRYDYRCTHPTATNVPSAATTGDCKLGTEGGKAYDGIRGSVRWLPTEKLEINLSADYVNDNSEATPSTLLFVGQTNGTPGPSALTYPRWTSAPTGGLALGNSKGSPFISYSPYGPYAQDTFSNSPYINYSTYADAKPPDGTAPFSVPPVSRLNSNGFSASIDYKLTDNLTFKSVTGYRYYSGNWSLDEDVSPLSDEVLNNTVWHRQLSQEVRLGGTLLNDKVNYSVGGIYLDQRSHYGGRIDLGSMEFIENDFIPADNKAVFANAGWHITDKLELNGGLRYTEENKTFIFGRGGVVGNNYPGGVAPAVAALDGATGSFHGDNVDYRVAVQYQWTDSVMTYANVSTGFKGGGVNPRPFFIDQVQPFAPETLTAYELGFKSQWFDRRLRLNGAAFLSEYSQIQLGVNNCAAIAPLHPAPCIAPINAGDGEMKGIELEAQALPIENLSIDATLSYLDFNYTNLSTYAIGSGITKSMTTPYAPKWKYSIGAEYEVSIGSAGSLTPRLDLSYQSSLYGGAINAVFNRIAGHEVLNGRLTWRPPSGGPWQISLECTNLTDKLYYLGLFDNRSSSQTTMGEPAPPRQWAITVKRSF